ncbi:MAG: 5'-3' exonuclease [Verrucomicrobia bacterium]|nr:MAG: 5'-3' exonuclease [Verrucomicrobiota bacterium]
MAKWLLIDGFNLAFRSFYAIPNLARSDGFPTNAIHGWVRTLWSLQDKEKPDHIAVFFDLGGSHARLELHPEYKAHRSETPQALREQFPWIKKVTVALGIPLIEEYGVEADDLVASAAIKLHNEGNEVYIVSADKDFGQLLCPGIYQLLPPPTANPKLGWRTLDEAGLLEKHFVKPNQIVDYLSLIGDASDNIPGIPGVGPKIAAKWIAEYGSIENILAKANYIQPARFQLVIPAMKDALMRNIEMIRLNAQLKIDFISEPSPNIPTLKEIFETMEMKAILKEAQRRFNFE